MVAVNLITSNENPLRDVWGRTDLELRAPMCRDVDGSTARAFGDPPTGRVPELLPTLFHDLSVHEVFTSGAPSFVAGCARAARALGARPGHLHTEEFFAEPQPWTAPVVTEVVS